MLAYGAGDAAAFARLFDRHERPVYRFLLRSLGGDAARAQDLLQEVWLAVIRNATSYEPRARFTTWLYGIARTRLIDHWRAQRSDVSLDAANDPQADDAGEPLVERVAGVRTQEPEVLAMSRAQALAFVAAVEALPDAQREVLLLHLEGELTLDEIAQLTGVGMETAKSRLRYALAKLRVALEQWR
ncbi:MAG: sigma-70 family RNA polymerase sigma factor [Gemmatimonadota bacterium]